MKFKVLPTMSTTRSNELKGDLLFLHFFQLLSDLCCRGKEDKDNVVLYFDSWPREELCIPLPLKQVDPLINDLKTLNLYL